MLKKTVDTFQKFSFQAIFCIFSIILIFPAYSATLYVGPGEAYTEIQPAIDAASDGDKVIVRDGTYILSSQISIDKLITVQSENGPGSAIIDGDNTTRCFYVNNAGAIVDGFTITNGRSEKGGGVFIDVAGGTVKNCIITENTADANGNDGCDACIYQPGGTYDGGAGGDGGDAYGGGIYLSGNGRILNCVITNNHAESIGGDGGDGSDSIVASGYATTFNKWICFCTEVGNGGNGGNSGYVYGGGAYLEPGSMMQNCTVINNTVMSSAGGGGFGGLVLDDCGICSPCYYCPKPDGTDGTLGSSFSPQGGGVYSPGSAILRNSIVYGNSVSNYHGGSFSYSCTSPDPGGVGNITNDPLFVDAAADDFRLLETSPCIDTGTPTGAPSEDIDGNPRPKDSGYDMGAYEYSPDSNAIGFAGGDGSSLNPYQISNVTELQHMENYLSSHFILINDIDASATSSWNSGAGFDPIGDSTTPFAGIFDGQGYEIVGLYINRPMENYAGLFGYSDSSAEIVNVTIKDADITGNSQVGSIAGFINYTTIQNCSSSGTVNGDDYIGGLLGSNSYGTVSCCLSSCNVISSGNYNGGFVGYNHHGGSVVEMSCSTGSVSGTSHVGGFVGFNNSGGSISDSYSTGNVVGNDLVGGFVGRNTGILAKSYSAGNVKGNVDYGGFMGSEEGSVTDCFWDTEASGQSISPYGTGKTTVEMTQETTFINWDFSDVWDIEENGSYPFLKTLGKHDVEVDNSPAGGSTASGKKSDSDDGSGGGGGCFIDTVFLRIRH